MALESERTEKQREGGSIDTLLARQKDWTEAHLMRWPFLLAKHIMKDEYPNRLYKPFHGLKLDCGTRFSPQKLLHETDVKEFSRVIYGQKGEAVPNLRGEARERAG